jgi:hypothetical protein
VTGHRFYDKLKRAYRGGGHRYTLILGNNNLALPVKARRVIPEIYPSTHLEVIPFDTNINRPT